MSDVPHNQVLAERRRIYQRHLAGLAAELDVLAGRLKAAAERAVDLGEGFDAGVLSCHTADAKSAAVSVQQLADINDRTFNGPRKRG